MVTFALKRLCWECSTHPCVIGTAICSLDLISTTLYSTVYQSLPITLRMSAASGLLGSPLPWPYATKATTATGVTSPSSKTTPAMNFLLNSIASLRYSTGWTTPTYRLSGTTTRHFVPRLTTLKNTERHGVIPIPVKHLLWLCCLWPPVIDRMIPDRLGLLA